MGKEMPWEHVTVVEKREEFVLLASQEGTNMSELCRRFGISRKTGYKWLNRFDGQGKTALVDHRAAPLQGFHLAPATFSSCLRDTLCSLLSSEEEQYGVPAFRIKTYTGFRSLLSTGRHRGLRECTT